MRTINTLYWIFTVLFAGFMVSTAVPNITSDVASIDLIKAQLGYPEYIIPFLGVAKVLGAIAIVVPGFPRIKEWAYAGLFFDLAGATFSVVAAFGFRWDALFMAPIFIIEAASYIFYHKRRNAMAAAVA